MLSKVLLVSLFAAVAVAAPALYPQPDVPYKSVISPGGVNPAPSPSVILLNSPTSGVGRIAGPQGQGTGTSNPPVINLNPPAPAPAPSVIDLNAPEGPPPVANLNAPEGPASIINLNRRQLSSLSPTSTFSFGGIVPSSTPLFSSGTRAVGGTVAPSSLAPVSTGSASLNSPGASNDTSIFSSTGPDGVKTVLLLSTTTVTASGAACSSAPTFNPSQVVESPLASSAIPPSSAFGANIQAPSPAPQSTPSIINLNSPPATPTSAPGFSFSSAPTGV